MNDHPLTWLEEDAYRERFEAAWFQHGAAEVQDFLPPPDHPLYRVVLRELLCVDMELAWGQPGRTATDYCRRFPELSADAAALAVLRDHEQRLSAPTAAEPAALPPTNLRPAAADPAPFAHGSLEHADWLLALQQQDPDAARLFAEAVPPPACGNDFLDFRLLRELGRGSFGQVFLAEQKGLADRLVALKVGPDLFGESQTLAQLQHNNIVPIYSAHRQGTLRAVCMPYFGPTTLADVLASMRQGGVPTVGNALWSTLHPGRADGPTSRPPEPAAVVAAPGPASLETLRHLPHVRAVLWIAARLADGLAHAHERGVLHRDLKPANVLLADDGTPMLLDFNLSQNARLRGGVPSLLGGTLPYMAPEHLEACRGGGQTVDARSDVYALGLILHELLTGRHPFPTYTGPLREQVPRMLADRSAGPPSAAEVNRAVTPAVAAIVRRCLHPDPARRYQSARHLQEDAQRHLDDLPLRHTPEPSPRERAAKFLRRHPRGAWVGAAAVLAALLVGVAVLYVNRGRHVERVEAVNTRLEHREELRDARILLGLPVPDAAELDEGEALCRAALARYGLPDADDWESRSRLTALDPADQQAVRADLGELLLLLARATWLRAGGLEPAGRGPALDAALRLNELAERLTGAQELRGVLLQRALLYRLAGRQAEAEATLVRGRELPLKTARDHYLLAGELASQGAVREAVGHLETATHLEPSNAAAWAARGACHSTLGQPQPAVAAFTTCIALRPGFWRGYQWRGQAYLDAHDHARAAADFDAVLHQRPGFVPALTFRALARLGQKDYAGAEADLTAALKGARHTRLYFIRARVRQAAGDAAGARHDFEEGLRLEPADELSWIARGVARLPDAPAAALADFEQALRLNRFSRDAAQNKAHVLAEHLNRPKEAIAILAPVVERYPDFTEARIGRGVLHARLGQRPAALADAAESLRRDTRPLILYQAGCVYALTSRQEPTDRLEAFRLLHRAVRDGFGAEHVETDADLAPLRSHADFPRLLALARQLKAAPP